MRFRPIEAATNASVSHDSQSGQPHFKIRE